MEKLVHDITKAVSEGKWVPIQLNKGGPKLTRLFFTMILLFLLKPLQGKQLSLMMF